MTDVLVLEKGTGWVSPVADGRGPRAHTHSRDRRIVSADIPTAGRELGNRLMHQLSDGRSIGAPVCSIICGPCCLPTAAVLKVTPKWAAPPPPVAKGVNGMESQSSKCGSRVDGPFEVEARPKSHDLGSSRRSHAGLLGSPRLLL